MAKPDRDAIRHLAAAVQHNCHISDAAYGRDYSLCIYLLKMREFYRWEQGYGFTAPLPKEALGDWLVGREQLWQTLEGSEFVPIEVNGKAFDPFDTDAVNDELLPQGLVYSGGVGGFAKPMFFLARLATVAEHSGYRILIAAEEYARDLTAPPALTLGTTIHLRKESLQRMLWEKMEEWQWKRRDNPMGRAAAFYPFETDFSAALDAMTDAEAHAAILHELGELEAGRRLGPRWPDLLLTLGGRRAELTARAIRDHLADCCVTLPTLLDEGAEASIHFYFANFTGIRRHTFPQLWTAYVHYRDRCDSDPLRAAAALGRERWATIANELLEAFAREGHEATPAIQERLARFTEVR